jgi:hypothetical protein
MGSGGASLDTWVAGREWADGNVAAEMFIKPLPSDEQLVDVRHWVTAEPSRDRT